MKIITCDKGASRAIKFFEEIFDSVKQYGILITDPKGECELLQNMTKYDKMR